MPKASKEELALGVSGIESRGAMDMNPSPYLILTGDDGEGRGSFLEEGRGSRMSPSAAAHMSSLRTRLGILKDGARGEVLYTVIQNGKWIAHA